MNRNNKLNMSERAVVQRINRKLKPDLQMLRKTRSARALERVRDFPILGDSQIGRTVRVLR